MSKDAWFVSRKRFRRAASAEDTVCDDCLYLGLRENIRRTVIM